VIHTALVREPIDPGEVLARVGAPEDGALVLFLGTVRNHAEGNAVERITYEAYEEMAGSVLAEIAREAAGLLGTDRLAVVHRLGDLAVGEHSVAIAVSSPHRAQAYEASRYVIEEIKKRLPVWKRERYADGSTAWVAGTEPSEPSRRVIQDAARSAPSEPAVEARR
jgi:molybdopterin synthase catalytic subunit